jgi:hypothetical protein
MTNLRWCVALAVAIVASASAPTAALAFRDTPPLVPAAADGLTQALETGRLTTAQYALERARALFRPRAVRARFGRVVETPLRLATLVLRDLAARRDELGPAERAQADALLGRPDDARDEGGMSWSGREAPGSPLCTTGRRAFCLHWTTTGVDAPPATDADADGQRDWVEETAATIRTILRREVGDLGFPMPKRDGTSDGDPRFDVYIADVGASGLYGYCTTDDPHAFAPAYHWYDVSAYCVLDNDFPPEQFSGATGQDANRVTAAHEIHHAEQYALDWLEGIWLLEAEATYMEHAVFPDIHDNYQYLAYGPISRPGTPLDLSEPSSFSVYGDWIFFEYLAERFGGPRVMRKLWSGLDGRRGRPNRYSLEEVARFLERRGSTLRRELSRFALANRRYENAYRLDGLPKLRTPVAAGHRLGRDARRRRGSWRARHLATRTYVFAPRKSVPARTRLRLVLDLPPHRTAPAARVVVVHADGSRRTHSFRLDASGAGALTVRFGTASRVELLLVNGSRRLRCWDASWPGPVYSCYGRPLDQRGRYRFTATLR